MYDVDQLKRTLPYVLKLDFRHVDGKNQVEAFGQLDGRSQVIELGKVLPTSTGDIAKMVLDEFPPSEKDVEHFNMKTIAVEAAEEDKDAKLDEGKLDETNKLLEEFK